MSEITKVSDFVAKVSETKVVDKLIDVKSIKKQMDMLTNQISLLQAQLDIAATVGVIPVVDPEL